MINIPISQSIRFRPIETALPTFDNTFDTEQRYIQYVAPFDLYIQVSRLDDSLAVPKMYIVECSGTETEVSITTTHTISGRVYYTFYLPFDEWNDKKLQLKVVEAFTGSAWVTTHMSEWFTIGAQPKMYELETNFYKLNWFNTENSFLTDYSTGLVNEMLVEAKMSMVDHGGESSIYSNQGIETKLKEIVYRNFTFECDVPNYIGEQLTLAMAHDKFFINEIEFVVAKKPTSQQNGKSNIYSFKAEVRQKTVIGINTHDVG